MYLYIYIYIHTHIVLLILILAEPTTLHAPHVTCSCVPGLRGIPVLHARNRTPFKSPRRIPSRDTGGIVLRNSEIEPSRDTRFAGRNLGRKGTANKNVPHSESFNALRDAAEMRTYYKEPVLLGS